jgi:hypothetical protein
MARRDSREAGDRRRPEARDTHRPPVEGHARQPEATPRHPGTAAVFGRETSITRGMRAAAERSAAERRAGQAGRARRRRDG